MGCRVGFRAAVSFNVVFVEVTLALLKLIRIIQEENQDKIYSTSKARVGICVVFFSFCGNMTFLLTFTEIT